MIRRFVATADSNTHAEFQAWRKANTRAPFLVVKSKTIANLHYVDCCWHCGSTDWDDPTAKGLANTEKITAESETELREYAMSRGLVVKPCAHCNKEK